MKKIILAAITSTLLFASPKTSVIFMIGDGMGPAHLSTYRYYHGDNTTTVFDTLLKGMNSTYSLNNTITDSAAAATALATGYKTDNGYIGSAKEDTEQTKSVLEFAKTQGYFTAMAVTSTLTHATPAAFLSHGHHRDQEAIIAKDFFAKTNDGQLKFDFLMGGGEKYFNAGFTDFNQTARENNIDIYRKGYDIDTIMKYPFIAFTAYDYPAFAIDEKGQQRYRVAKMTKKSLELLEGKPFFLMVEGSQIDWCAHLNDIACTMAEIEDFAKAVSIAKNYVDKHPQTLLIVTADHSTGGLAIGKKIKKDNKSLSEEEKSKSYLWHKEVIQKIKASSIAIAKALKKSADINHTFKTYTDITLTEKEYREIQQSLFSTKMKTVWNTVNSIVNTRSNTGWTSHGHTAVDVETFAYGKGSDKFSGYMDNTDIAKKIFEILSGK